MRSKVLVFLGIMLLAIFTSCDMGYMGNRYVISRERTAEGLTPEFVKKITGLDLETIQSLSLK